MANPYVARLKHDPIGLGLLLVLPVVMLAVLLAGKAQAVATSALVLAWLSVGLFPTALGAHREPAVEARWRSLPLGAADRFFQAVLGLVPATLAAGAALTAVGYLMGPVPLRVPMLFAVGLLTTAVMAAVGLAIAAWTRTRWQAAALAVVFVLAAVWGASAPVFELLPTGQAQRALSALARPAEIVDPLIKMGLMGLVWAGLALAGFGRR